MSDWRLIALDMDGTLLEREGTISAENKLWIRKAREAGVEVTLATGRYIRLVQPYVEELGLNAPVVTNNGSEVWTADGKLLQRHIMKTEDIRFLHDLALEYNTYYWSSVAGNMFKPSNFPELIEDYQWLKFGFHHENQDVIERIWDKIERRGQLELSSSGKKNIEINPLGITKVTGLQVVCRVLGISPAQVVTMGDGLNDVAMLKWSGLGIAMDNAPESVKAASNRTTAHYLEHGVAKAIEQLLREI